MHRFIVLLAVVLTAQMSSAQAILPVRSPGIGFARKYLSSTDGIPIRELIRLALAANGEIAIARLEVERAEARLIQAGARPNPTLQVEQESGRPVGSPGEGKLTVGVEVPLEVFGQRGRRMDAAEAEIALRRAEIAAKERSVTGEVIVVYIEALVLVREIATMDEVLTLDEETARFVQLRVNEGETAPLELSLLQAEVERLRARRLLFEGRLQASISKLKFFAGIPHGQPLKLAEDITTASFRPLPQTAAEGVGLALKNRPEVRISGLQEELAEAELKVAESRSRPDISATARYAQGRSVFDDPLGAYAQRDRSLAFGVSIGLPVFDRGKGEKAEAAIAIRQARERRIFAENVIRSEVTAAFERIAAAERSLNTFRTSVLPRSRANIETVRKVYEIGDLKVTDLIAEQRKLLETDRDLIEIHSEKYRAEADLFLAIGLLMEK
ncbi:MAG: TolC family protein [Acidobacteria bacterium]|nr:TolC family protein [Acidobacteriota bacterium]